MQQQHEVSVETFFWNKAQKKFEQKTVIAFKFQIGKLPLYQWVLTLHPFYEKWVIIETGTGYIISMSDSISDCKEEIKNKMAILSPSDITQYIAWQQKQLLLSGFKASPTKRVKQFILSLSIFLLFITGGIAQKAYIGQIIPPECPYQLTIDYPEKGVSLKMPEISGHYEATINASDGILVNVVYDPIPGWDLTMRILHPDTNDFAEVTGEIFLYKDDLLLIEPKPQKK